MLGTLQTQQLFASANSIATIPKIYAEWNYNSFITPYVINSGSGSQILASDLSWTADSSGLVSYSASAGRKTDYNTNTSCSALIITSSISNPSSAFTSNSTTLNAASDSYGFYKFVFYVKVGDVNKTDGFPSTISFSASGAAGTASTLFYRVVGVGSNGQTLGPDLISNSDVVKKIYGGGDIALTITNDSRSNAYNIYRSNLAKSSTASSDAVLIATIKKDTTQSTTSYTDNQTISGTYMTNYDFNSKVAITPQIKLVNAAGSEVNSSMAVRSYDAYSKGGYSNDGTVYAQESSWQKVEVLFGIPQDQAENYFKSVQLILNLSSQYQNATLLVDQPELYAITERDYFSQNYAPTDSAFLPYRPGELFVNYNVPSSIKTLNFSNTTIARPVTFRYYSPEVLVLTGTGTSVNAQTQAAYHEYDHFKYYVSSAETYEPKAIQGFYDTFISMNKIILKYNTTFNVPSSGSVIVYTGTSRTPTKIELTSSSFNSNGCTVLYYNGSSWQSTAWTTPPELSASGTLQNVVASVSGLSFVVTDQTVNTKWSTSKDPNNKDYKRLHLVEISPRLEIDVSPYAQTFDVKKDISSPYKAGLPFSYINSNSGTIKLSNIPNYVGTSGAPRTVFENDPQNAPFKNLLRKGVKFTGQLVPVSYTHLRAHETG
jgi:hypothetical protein